MEKPIDLAEAITTAAEKVNKVAMSRLTPPRKLVRCIDGQIDNAFEMSLEALSQENENDRFFQRNGKLALAYRYKRKIKIKGVDMPTGTLVIAVPNQHDVALKLSKLVQYGRYTRGDKEPRMKDMDPPERLCRMIAYCAGNRLGRLPLLVGTLESPTIDIEGRVIQTPGYDEESGLLLDFGAGEFPQVPEQPSVDDVARAIKTISEPFNEFPFSDLAEVGVDLQHSADFSTAISAVLTAIVRRLLPTAPMFVFDAPTPGSGKTLLSAVVGYIATGRTPANITQALSQVEEQKVLTSILLQSPLIINIDNVDAPLGSKLLCTMLTSDEIHDRILGKNQIPALRTNSLFLANGNNIVIRGDLASRSLSCRINPAVEDPSERQFTRNLHTWVPQRRAELVVAALTIIKGWFHAGCPKPAVKSFGDRFGDWQRLCRYPLVWAGLADPCKTKERIAISDPEKDLHLEFLKGLYKAFGNQPKSGREIAISVETLGEQSVGSLRLVINDLNVRNKGGEISTASLGQKLKKYVDTVCKSMVLREKVCRANVRRYYVEGKPEDDENTNLPVEVNGCEHDGVESNVF